MGSVPTEGIASLSVNNHKCINFLILGLSLYVLIRSDTPAVDHGWLADPSI